MIAHIVRRLYENWFNWIMAKDVVFLVSMLALDMLLLYNIVVSKYIYAPPSDSTRTFLFQGKH
jgi:hypothetical protein